jgi:threonyl-tRNA synthetase
MKRLRAFTMPDMHTICTDLDQAEEEFRRQFWLSKDVLSKIGIDESKYETAIRFTQDFWKDHQDFIKGIVKELKRPVLIEMWNYRYAYFDPKFEFNIIDSLDKATALSTVQIDHENGKRYDMTYIDSQGKKQYPLVLHCSPSGAIERVIYALLEISALQDSKPHLPLWLSPTQIRLLPLSDKFISKCEEIAAKIQARNIRVDIDDTESTLSKKIMNAEEEWIPYICVVGQKEIEENKLSVRERETGANNNMDLESLMDKIDAVVKDMPKARSSLPMLVSKRPIFNK